MRSRLIKEFVPPLISTNAELTILETKMFFLKISTAKLFEYFSHILATPLFFLFQIRTRAELPRAWRQ